MSLITAILQLKAGQAYGFSFNTSSIRFSDFWNRQFWSPVFIVFTPFNSRQSRMLNSVPWVHHVHGALSHRPSYLWKSTLPTSIL